MHISRSTQHKNRIGFSCIISQENISINKYSNILKAKKLKRTKEATKKIMEWEEMCRECQNLGWNLREKHITWHDKSIKMQKCVCGRERHASLKLVEISSGRLLLDQHTARPRPSRCKNRSVRTLHTENLKLEKICRKKYFL